jgi:hypothetical protein
MKTLRLRLLVIAAYLLGIELTYSGQFVSDDLTLKGTGRTLWREWSISEALANWHRTTGVNHGEGLHHFRVTATIQTVDSLPKETKRAVAESPAQVDAFPAGADSGSGERVAVPAGATSEAGDGSTATLAGDPEAAAAGTDRAADPGGKQNAGPVDLAAAVLGK